MAKVGYNDATTFSCRYENGYRDYVSKKDKLLARLRERPRDFTWAEACAVMKGHGFTLRTSSGSGRLFLHEATRTRVRLHEPHPSPVLLRYAMDDLLDGLIAAGEIEK